MLFRSEIYNITNIHKKYTLDNFLFNYDTQIELSYRTPGATDYNPEYDVFYGYDEKKTNPIEIFANLIDYYQNSFWDVYNTCLFKSIEKISTDETEGFRQKLIEFFTVSVTKDENSSEYSFITILQIITRILYFDTEANQQCLSQVIYNGEPEPKEDEPFIPESPIEQEPTSDNPQEPETPIDFEEPKVEDNQVSENSIDTQTTTEPEAPIESDEPETDEPLEPEIPEETNNDDEPLFPIEPEITEEEKPNEPVIPADNTVPENTEELECSDLLNKMAEECECADEVEKEILEELDQIKLDEEEIDENLAQIKLDQEAIKHEQDILNEELLLLNSQ